MMIQLNFVRLCGVLFALLACGTSAFAEQVVVTAGGHPRSATGQTVTYTGKCMSGAYQMHISQEQNRVEFVLEGARNPVDLSGIQFGKTFLAGPITGQFAFTCLDNTLRVNFTGFEVQAGTQPRPVKYFLALNYNGEVVEDDGLTDAPLELVTRRMVPRKAP